MTFTIYYTDRSQLDSELVNRAWYDDLEGKLYLELHGLIYAYETGASVYQGLTESVSAGSYYNHNIKGRYKGKRLGPVSDAKEVNAEHVPTAWGGDLVTSGNTVNNTYWDNNDAPEPYYGGVKVETPSQPLNVQVYSNRPGERSVQDVHKVEIETPKVKLNSVPDTLHDYTFKFTLGVDGDTKSHRVKAQNEDDAIEQILSLGDLFGQELTLKSMLVEF